MKKSLIVIWLELIFIRMILKINEHIDLKSVQLSDAAEIFEVIDRERETLRRWLPFVDKTLSVTDTENYIQSVESMPLESRDLVFAIRYQGVFAGLVGLKNRDANNKRAEIGYWLSKAFQRKGLVTDSVKGLIRLAFEKMGLHRIQIKCAVNNIQSKNIPRRLNFILEGTERDGKLLVDGVYTDLEVYSILNKKR